MKPSERSLEGVMAELKALRQAYGAAQRRCTATVQRLHARNQLLEAEVLQLRAQLAAREPSMAMAGEEQRRMLEAAGAAQAGRATLSARIESLAQRLQTLLRGTSASSLAGAWPAASQGAVPETGTSTRPPGQPLHPTGDAHAGGSDATDDVEDPSDLEERLVEADLVICQTGCLSHQAYWRVQDHCCRHNKPCVLVAQPDALRIIRIHQRDDGARAGASAADDGPGVPERSRKGVPDAPGRGAGSPGPGRGAGSPGPGQGTDSQVRTVVHQQESSIT